MIAEIKTKLTYDDIRLNGKVKLFNEKSTGEIVSIENFASLGGINEPVFTVRTEHQYYHFGLKYILKYYIGS